MDKFIEILSIVIKGAGFTLSVAFSAGLIGIVIGLVMSLSKLSHNIILKSIANVYIEVIRGTPLFVQIFLFHFGVASNIHRRCVMLFYRKLLKQLFQHLAMRWWYS